MNNCTQTFWLKLMRYKMYEKMKQKWASRGNIYNSVPFPPLGLEKFPNWNFPPKLAFFSVTPSLMKYCNICIRNSHIIRKRAMTNLCYALLIDSFNQCQEQHLQIFIKIQLLFNLCPHMIYRNTFGDFSFETKLEFIAF